MLSLIIPLLIPVTLVLLFKLLNKQHKPPIFGVYQQRNKYYWFKFVAMYIVLGVRQLLYRAKRAHAVEVGKSGDGTIHVHEQDMALERKYYLGDHAQSIDAVYFNALSEAGEAVICGLARRPKNICDAFLYLKIKEQELLLSPILPDTQMEQTTVEQGEYKVQGIEIVNFIPMRTWKLNYKGEMKPKNDPEKRVNVEMELTWSAHFPPFNYDTQISPFSMASDIAGEKWSRDYFKLLKKCHQTHYEQMGSIEGTVTIDGKEHVLNMPCVRDHSFGPFRDWRTFHRYVYHFMFLENGDCMAVGTVSQPGILSHLTIGYVCRKSDQSVHPVVRSDFKLYHHGENQILPKDYGFTFKAGRQSYVVRVQVEDEDSFYIGKSREAKFYERWSKIDVNGVSGRACVEWQYNNVGTNR